MSSLGNAIEFLKNFGFFDVVLPFLLVFTIVFGILEKTKILGYEGTTKTPKKNLNAMVAFAIAFFFIAASNLVYVIQISLPAITMVLLILVVLMLLMGSLAAQSDTGFDIWGGSYKWVAITGMIFVFVAVIVIFLYAFGYLEPVFYYIQNSLNKDLVATVGLIALVIIALYTILKSGSTETKGDKKI
ncbi:MAG: hypothetical protein Q7R96_02205 [Nanoarchaeota archaeon]|nr:hypothetical protein [Nanoarchaeota archaeon]